MEEKILLAYQFWSKEFDWYTPNGHPEDWILNGEKELPYCRGLSYFSITNYPNLENRYVDYKLIKSLNLSASKYSFIDKQFTTTALLKDIPQGSKYILPICIDRIDYFYNQNPYGFKFLLPRVIKDVQNNLAKIVLIFPHEGNTAYLNDPKFGSFVTNGSQILDQWCKNHGFQKNQVYFLNANLLADEHDKIVKNYTSMSLDMFINWLPLCFMVNNFKLSDNFIPKNKQYLFLSYNRQKRTHRDILILNLNYKNLLDQGIVSYNNTLDKLNLKLIAENYKTSAWMADITSLQKKLPLILDFNLDKENPAIQITEHHYQQTFISLVSETHWEKETIFRSEKIYKTIAVGHPFIVLSSPYFLKSLKELGFRTFSQWIDESYDEELDLCKRIDKITDELLKFSKMSISELQLIRNEMKSTVHYNQRLIINLYNQELRCNSTSRHLIEIWKNFNRPRTHYTYTY